MQSLRKGRDCQCRTYPIHAVSAELVKIALPSYSAGGFDEKRATANAKMTSLRMMAACKRRELQFSATRLEHSAQGGPM